MFPKIETKFIGKKLFHRDARRLCKDLQSFLRDFVFFLYESLYNNDNKKRK